MNNYYISNDNANRSDIENQIRLWIIIFYSLVILFIICYLVFNTLYHKKKKTVFLWLSLLPKLVLVIFTFAPLLAIVLGLHYKQFNNYEEIEIKKNYNYISEYLDLLKTDIDDVEEVFWYTSNNEDFVVLLDTKYKDYKVETKQRFLELLDIASELESDLIPHEIKDITVFVVISYIIAVVLGVIFIKDKKNILLITAIAGFFLCVILSNVMA